MFAQHDTEGCLSFNKDRDTDKCRLPVNGPWWLNRRGNVSHWRVWAQVTSTPFCDNSATTPTTEDQYNLFFLYLFTHKTRSEVILKAQRETF